MRKGQSPQMADHGRGWQGHVRPDSVPTFSAEKGSLSEAGVRHNRSGTVSCSVPDDHPLGTVTDVDTGTQDEGDTLEVPTT